MESSTTVYIIDPDERDRNRVRDTVGDLDVRIAMFSSAEQFLEACRDAEPDDPRGCVIAELRLLGMNGLELQCEMTRRRIHLPLIIVTGHAETGRTVSAMRAGAVSVLDKPASPQDLWDAIYRALCLDEENGRRDLRRRAAEQRLGQLTTKERLVLKLMFDGLPNKVIARRLDVSIRTVETRRAQLFAKTGTQSVAELVRFVLAADPTRSLTMVETARVGGEAAYVSEEAAGVGEAAEVGEAAAGVRQTGRTISGTVRRPREFNGSLALGSPIPQLVRNAQLVQ